MDKTSDYGGGSAVGSNGSVKNAQLKINEDVYNSNPGMESGCDNIELSDIFYTSHKKGNVFRVKLDRIGFTLQRETQNNVVKEQLIKLCDIVGARCMCMRVQKERRLGTCACTTSSSPVRRSVAINGDGSTAIASVDVSAYLYVFAYLLKKKLRNNWRRERTMLTLRFQSFDTFEENMREAEHWYRILKGYKNQMLDEVYLRQPPQSQPRRRLLVFINPKSGSGKARELFHQEVSPVLNESEMPYDMYVTKNANYARDFVQKRNLNTWAGIVAVGGDGLFFEILNGIMQRYDWREILSNKPLGIVPCGSGNGLARSIAHVYKEPYEPKPILGAALTIISGQTAPMDAVRIELHNQVIYSFLSVGWGLISDIDIESERLRTFGYQRFTIWTLHRLISLRSYSGKISYLPKNREPQESAEAAMGATSSLLKHSRSCNTYLNKADYEDYFQSTEFMGSIAGCGVTGGGGSDFDDVISLETSFNQSSFRSRCDSWLSAGSRKSTYYSITDSIYHSVAGDTDDDEETPVHGRFGLRPSGGGGAMRCDFSNASAGRCIEGLKAPTLHSAVPSSWLVEEGEFIMAHAAYQTHLGVNCFFAPQAKLDDATIYLVIIRKGIGRSQLLNFMLGLSSGSHLPPGENEFIKVIAVSAFRIEPYDAQGIITVDGERVSFGAIQGEILPSVVRVMVPNKKFD